MPTIRLAFSSLRMGRPGVPPLCQRKGGRLTLHRSKAWFLCVLQQGEGKILVPDQLWSHLCVRLLLSVCYISHWIHTANPFHERSKCTSVSKEFAQGHTAVDGIETKSASSEDIGITSHCSLVQVTQRAHVHGVVERIPRSLQIPHLSLHAPTRHFVDIYWKWLKQKNGIVLFITSHFWAIEDNKWY